MTITKTTTVADKVVLAVKKIMPKESDYYQEPYQNGREHGWTLCNFKKNKMVAFSEFRRSDSIVVYSGKIGDFEMAGNLPSEKIYDDKNFFHPGDYQTASEFIVSFLEK